MHQRRVIRTAIRDALDGATTAGARVYATRVLPHRKTELPAIAVYTLEEASDDEETAPRELKREMPVTIEAWVAATAGVNVDDALDDIAEEIETAMHADPHFGDQVSDSVLVATDLEVVDDGDRLMGLAILTYNVTYYTLAPAAPTNLDDFRTVGATHQVGGDDTEDAEDVFTVQEAP